MALSQKDQSLTRLLVYFKEACKPAFHIYRTIPESFFCVYRAIIDSFVLVYFFEKYYIPHSAVLSLTKMLRRPVIRGGGSGKNSLWKNMLDIVGKYWT